MSELCGELWLETGSPFLSTGDDMTQSAEAASDLSCELCGSSCNERDELIKCEREIKNLRLETSRLRAVIERALNAEYELSIANETIRELYVRIGELESGDCTY